MLSCRVQLLSNPSPRTTPTHNPPTGQSTGHTDRSSFSCTGCKHGPPEQQTWPATAAAQQHTPNQAVQARHGAGLRHKQETRGTAANKQPHEHGRCRQRVGTGVADGRAHAQAEPGSAVQCRTMRHNIRARHQLCEAPEDRLRSAQHTKEARTSLNWRSCMQRSVMSEGSIADSAAALVVSPSMRVIGSSACSCARRNAGQA